MRPRLRGTTIVVLFLRGSLSRIGNGLVELRHGQRARHAEFSDDEGWRALETERGGLIVVARQNRVDRLGVGFEVLAGTMDVDAGVAKQFADPRLGQSRSAP